MSVLLPTTTVRVLSGQQTLDSHGAQTTFGWTERGPYEAAVVETGIGAGAGESHVDLARAEYRLTVVIDPAAWPIREADRLIDGDDSVYEVEGALLRRDPSGSGRLDHVSVKVLRIVGAL